MAFAVEKSFTSESRREWMVQNWTQTIYWVAAYVAFIYIGRWYMRNREPFELKNPLILWNAALAIFSITGTARTMPEFVSSVQKNGFAGSYCKVGEFFEGVNGLWIWLFHLSKLLELVDTVFLVLRKRPVIFLHWYHHASVLIYTWFIYAVPTPMSRWGIWMNYTVHSFMYTYYMLRAAGVKVPHRVSMAITSMQIVQFIVGTYICWDTVYRVILGRGACDCPPLNAIVAFLLYTSYLVLFVNFFYQSYVKKGKRKVA